MLPKRFELSILAAYVSKTYVYTVPPRKHEASFYFTVVIRTPHLWCFPPDSNWQKIVFETIMSSFASGKQVAVSLVSILPIQTVDNRVVETLPVLCKSTVLAVITSRPSAPRMGNDPIIIG